MTPEVAAALLLLSYVVGGVLWLAHRLGWTGGLL